MMIFIGLYHKFVWLTVFSRHVFTHLLACLLVWNILDMCYMYILSLLHICIHFCILLAISVDIIMDEN